MFQFLQANATLVFFGLALLFMFWMHSGRGHSMGGGGGCGMGHQHDESDERGSSHQHGNALPLDAKPVEPPLEKWGSLEKEPATPVAVGADHTTHAGGCH